MRKQDLAIRHASPRIRRKIVQCVSLFTNACVVHIPLCPQNFSLQVIKVMSYEKHRISEIFEYKHYPRVFTYMYELQHKCRCVTDSLSVQHVLFSCCFCFGFTSCAFVSVLSLCTCPDTDVLPDCFHLFCVLPWLVCLLIPCCVIVVLQSIIMHLYHIIKLKPWLLNTLVSISCVFHPHLFSMSYKCMSF